MKLEFSPFYQVCIITFTSLFYKLAAWDNVSHLVELKLPKKKKLWPNVGSNVPKSGQNKGFPAFLVRRGKVLLNWYFISVDYIEFLSPITRLRQNNEGHAIEKSWNLFYFNFVERPVKLACFITVMGKTKQLNQSKESTRDYVRANSVTNPFNDK